MNLNGKIRILIVEDSPTVYKALTKIIHQEDNLEIVGIAKDGEQAIELTEKYKPDLITMDIKLPKLNGLEATKHIMAYNPTPILVVTSKTYKRELNLSFNAIYYGALDVIEKGQIIYEEYDSDFALELIEKINLLSKIKVIHHPQGRLKKINRTMSRQRKNSSRFSTIVVGIAASTGGPQVIYNIINNLPKKINFAVVIVQHIVSSFCEGFAEWLAQGTSRHVKLVENDEKIEPNTFYVAPGNHHIEIQQNGHFNLLKAPPYKGHRPSANIMFRSLAENAPYQSLGVILTGMGNDGVEGLKELCQKKAPIIAQDESTSIVYGMPKACFEAGIATSVLPKEKIADEIIFFTNQLAGVRT